MRKNILKLVAALLLSFIMIGNIIFIPTAQTAEAAAEYITVEYFAEYLTKELGLKSINGSAESGSVNALMEKGIIKEGDFKSYTGYLTRGDAMVLINRADEYLYGDTLDANLVQLAIDKRISDISKVKSSKREDVAKAYLKGYVKGYSNGEYSTDRTMKVKNKITKSGALGCIKMLKNKSLRAQISPDGQLIRTTNLPNGAEYYPYILASYPNEYYNWVFQYMGVTASQYNFETGKMEEIKLVNLIDYAAPVDVDKTTLLGNFSVIKKEYLDTWVNKVKTHMERVFNVDYRTIGPEWTDEVAKVSYSYGYWGTEDMTKINLEDYVSKVKKNKTIIESNKIAVDGSSLYFYDKSYYLRVYVKYRIVSSLENYNDGVLHEDNNIFFTSYPISINKYKKGEWKECCFDVELASASEDERENMGVLYAILVEYYFSDYKIK